MATRTQRQAPTHREITTEQYREFHALQARDWEYNAARRRLEKLQAITAGCRVDMHEPDENDLIATISGNHLDNAMGDCNPASACGEFIVTLQDCGGNIQHFNLASLIALARLADVRKLLEP